MKRPNEQKLREILARHLDSGWENSAANQQLATFMSKLESGNQIAIDQLLNAVYLTMSKVDVNPADHDIIQQAVMRSLSEDTAGEISS